MSSATLVPETSGLTGGRALDTMRRADVRRLMRDSITRLRAADGMSHARALAYQLVLALIPGTIVLVALASELRWESLSRAIIRSVEALAPGPSADVFREAFGQGEAAGSRGAGRSALSVGIPALLISGTTAFGQLERSANRIYGIETDRVSWQKYGLGAVVMLTAGTLAVLYFLVVGLGAAWTGDGSSWEDIWLVGRWPLALLLLAASIAIVFKVVPRRRQPPMSWLAIGGLIAVAGCVLVAMLLTLYLNASQGFDEAYGALAGFMGVLLWAYGSCVAVLFGLSFAAQLEAVRAGVARPQDDGKVRDSEPDSAVIPYGTAMMPGELRGDVER